eukprot:CAMPEP_0177763786 /NCGR_PEP_ID=MMETSP0491_2-20121128/7051_1 /TAXON_ID=63592 /ORGANISM="Tetraselmis chuii, Strain PLY429" /LENGTH=1004 /DNA_ID=CAMNT_0019279905 /DNA_START=153 /DNA_END=3167 /DNA_ORIENTATION=-
MALCAVSLRGAMPGRAVPVAARVRGGIPRAVHTRVIPGRRSLTVLHGVRPSGAESRPLKPASALRRRAVGTRHYHAPSRKGSSGQSFQINANSETVTASVGTKKKVGKVAAPGGIPLVFRDGNLETGAGIRILSNLGDCFSVREGEDGTEAMIFDLDASERSSQIDVPLGKLECQRHLSAGRCKLWWMTPEFGTGATGVPPETQFLLTELEEGGPYALIVPLISDCRFRGTLRPPPNGHDAETVWLRMESNSESVAASSIENTVLVQASWDLYGLVDQAVALAASYSGGSKPLSEKVLPPSVDVFGWCTWDAFYSRVSAKGIREGLQSLINGGIPPKLLVIDDGWQQTDIDEEQKKMFGDDNILMEEVVEAERQALLAEASALASKEAGSAAASATMSLAFVEDEEDAQERKRQIVQSIEEMSDLPRETKDVQPWLQKVKNFIGAGFDNVLGWALGLGEAAFIKFYQRFIDPAPPGSRPVKFFTWVANGPLRMPMLQFYMATGDFTKRLTDVTANSKFATPLSGPKSQGVSSNLRAVVDSLKLDFAVQYVYCWHGLPGYWGGISPESPSMQKFNPRVLPGKATPGVLEVEPSMAWGPSALAGVGVVDDHEAMYEAMHEYLAREGIDGVKVDCQAGIGLIPCSDGTPAKSAAYQYSLEKSVKKHFPGNHIINCMCHSSENFFRFLDSSVARACDDFYPMDRASHTTHIANSAYNSVFLGALVQPDWDMFQSEHPANLLHAAARAVSGGAVYVSDKPGKHNFDLLRRLVLPDGTVLRANLPGRPTVDTVFCDVMRDGKSLLKVWNRNNCSGVVGVFNVQGSSWDRTRRKYFTHDESPPTLSTAVRVRDVDGYGRQDAAGECEYIAYCSNSGRLERLTEHPSSALEVELLSAGSEVVTLVEVGKLGGVEFAPIGLTGMLNPGGAVLSLSSRLVKKAPTFAVHYRGCGDFTAVTSAPPAHCMLLPEGSNTPVELKCYYDPGNSTARVDVPVVEGLRGELLFSFPPNQN